MKTLIWITLVIILMVLFDISQEMQLSEADKVKLQEQKTLQIKQDNLVKEAQEREQQSLIDQQRKFAALSWAEVPDDRWVEWTYLNVTDSIMNIGFIIVLLSVLGWFYGNYRRPRF